MELIFLACLVIAAYVIYADGWLVGTLAGVWVFIQIKCGIGNLTDCG